MSHRQLRRVVGALIAGALLAAAVAAPAWAMRCEVGGERTMTRCCCPAAAGGQDANIDPGARLSRTRCCVLESVDVAAPPGDRPGLGPRLASPPLLHAVLLPAPAPAYGSAPAISSRFERAPPVGPSLVLLKRSFLI